MLKAAKRSRIDRSLGRVRTADGRSNVRSTQVARDRIEMSPRSYLSVSTNASQQERVRIPSIDSRLYTNYQITVQVGLQAMNTESDTTGLREKGTVALPAMWVRQLVSDYRSLAGLVDCCRLEATDAATVSLCTGRSKAAQIGWGC